MSAIFVQYLQGYAPRPVAEQERLLTEAGFVRLAGPPTAEGARVEVWALLDTAEPLGRSTPLASMTHAERVAWVRQTIQPGCIHDAQTLRLCYN